SWITDVAGEAFFAADDNFHGDEVWKSDGFVFGTALAADICPGQWRSAPSWLVQFHGVLYLHANDFGPHLAELWEVDSAVDTTTSLVSSGNPSTSGAPASFTATVAPVAPGTGTPNGTVTSNDRSTTLGTATLASGKATS